MRPKLKMLLANIILCLFASGLLTVHIQAADTIKIGTIMPISGPLSIVGMSWTRGFALGADYINENGGVNINGKQYILKILSEDTQGSAEGGRASALKLVHKDGVKYILGGILEPAIEAMNKVCEEAGVFYGATNANIPGHPADVSPDKPMQIRLNKNHDDNHEANVQFLSKHYPDVKTIALSAPDLGYDPMIKKLEADLASAGMTLIHKEIWQWGTTDFMPVMTRILASKPNAVFAMVSGQAQYQLSAARQLGFKGPFISNSPLAAEVFLAVSGPQACDQVIVNNVNSFQPNPMVKEILDRWAKRYKEPPVVDAVMGFDAIWLMAQVFEKAQNLEPKTIVATFEKLTNLGDLETSYGPARMGGKERFGVNRVLYRPSAITHLVKGKVVETEYFAP